MHKFLMLEKNSNAKMLELHKSTDEGNLDEEKCVQKYRNNKYITSDFGSRDPVVS